MHFSKPLVRAILFIICILIIYVFAFSYLKLNNKPVKSDIIVLFIGLEYKKRLEEAHQLLKENHAKKLIIPAYHSEYILKNGKINRIRNFQKNTLNTNAYPRYYENTHVEALEARKMMDTAGYKSAIFVSSPFHMRRISIIASRVFGAKDYQISFIGSRYLLQDNRFLSMFKWYKIRQIFSEYLKIAGFFLYQFKESLIHP